MTPSEYVQSSVVVDIRTVQLASPGEQDGAMVSPGEYGDVGGAAYATEACMYMNRLAINITRDFFDICIRRERKSPIMVMDS